MYIKAPFGTVSVNYYLSPGSGESPWCAKSCSPFAVYKQSCCLFVPNFAVEDYTLSEVNSDLTSRYGQQEGAWKVGAARSPGSRAGRRCAPRCR